MLKGEVRLHESDVCLICGKNATDHHHCLGGRYRQDSEDYGLTISVCRECHRKLHDIPGAEYPYKRMAQIAFEYKYGHERWMKVFGKNYL